MVTQVRAVCAVVCARRHMSRVSIDARVSSFVSGIFYSGPIDGVVQTATRTALGRPSRQRVFRL